MPGATTASAVFLEAAIAWKLVMMPQTVPNRPMKGAGGADRRQEQETPLEPLDLAGDGDVEHLVDARLEADRRARAGLEAPLPFAHRRDEDRGHAVGVRPVSER